MRGRVIEALATVPPRNGRDVTLALDRRIRHAAFRELQAAVERADARSGSAIVLGAHTGEILAMTNFPSYDPNISAARTGIVMRNRAVTDVLEPGSVMTPLTIALALQMHQVNPPSIVSSEGGHLRIYGVTIYEQGFWYADGVGRSAEIEQCRYNIDRATVKVSGYVE
ncbi:MULTISPECIES: penicillin-binding transpeptidase domain-containing protein [unclassified Caballeronia]|uniref:penicillin-binding transpeptidase domain-containing protein n=1 Tax=unclassified Caballeronia TaxID=2646786 RepID=UPI002857E471|nr:MULTISPECIES: penicillin-binding transpeptidase domain-containing protein [unclassified Caballeronia]MDR5755234.1 penicillin-binding transpeptidase domain-containing protein [Caballeronia sp. LZ024]MDR5845598.1 penicillin-binding transpeptidase domain-containing protein [Caballeronia sp. LZ031]